MLSETTADNPKSLRSQLLISQDQPEVVEGDNVTIAEQTQADTAMFEQEYADVAVRLSPYHINIDGWLVKVKDMFTPREQRRAIDILHTIANRRDYREGLAGHFITFRTPYFMSAAPENSLVLNLEKEVDDLEQQVRSYIITNSPSVKLETAGLVLTITPPGDILDDPHKTVPLKLRHAVTRKSAHVITQKILEPTQEFFEGVSSWDQFESYVKEHIRPEMHPSELLALYSYKQVLEQVCVDKHIGDGYIALTSPMSWQVAADVSLKEGLERYITALELLINNAPLQEKVAGKKLEFTFGEGAVAQGYAVIQLRETPELTWQGFEQNTNYEQAPEPYAPSPYLTQAREADLKLGKTQGGDLYEERLKSELRITEAIAELAKQGIAVNTNILEHSFGQMAMRQKVVLVLESLRDVPQARKALHNKQLEFSLTGPTMVVLPDGNTVQLNINQPALAILIELNQWGRGE